MHRQIMLNNNKIILELLREEEEDDQLLLNTKNKKRKSISNLFSTRKSEGFFEKLIKGHLATDNIKFREFFRLNRRQFDFVLSLIKISSMRISSSAAEKIIYNTENGLNTKFDKLLD